MFVISQLSAKKSFEDNFKKYYKRYEPKTYKVVNSRYPTHHFHSIVYFDYILDAIDLSLLHDKKCAVRNDHFAHDVFELFINFMPKSIHHEIFMVCLDDYMYQEALVLHKIKFNFIFKIIELISKIMKCVKIEDRLDPYMYTTAYN